MRGAGLVLALYALPAGLIVACSKATTDAPPAAPSVVTDPSPKVAPSTSGSDLMWASSASASASVAPSASAKTFACGPEGMPRCPLQDWMEKELKPAMKGTDTAKVASLFDKLSKMAPAKYADWSKMATDVATEVRAKKDLGPAKKSCKTCHDQYKKQWKSEDRDHPI
jgi:hypothetical protein